MSAARFHPAVSAWFKRVFAQPTEPQRLAWPAIAAGRHTLIAAPTGSGKTLAAFLAAIDALIRQGLEHGLPDETQVVYVSPLKALSNDIERNLRQPLAGIRAELAALGLPDVDIRVQVRTGDTSPADRAAMRKTPPHILVTTPESLYLLLTSESGRAMLATARSAIVDEIHAIAGTKRGAHLALSLERLCALNNNRASEPAPRRITRIGLSATQKPIEEIARLLVGADTDAHGRPDCTIIDTGHARRRDLALELPGSPLAAVMPNEVWEQLYDRLAQLVQAHRTTLVFVNTRRLAERVTRHLSERLGKEHVTSHHGSLAKESRFDAEQRLKRGELRALVATASLELGIDIGDVDLVCQLGSPRAISTFLQRVGRSGHTVGGLPKGRLFPLTRDELIECAALLKAVDQGELDRVRIPAKPLDVLAQQIVAEVAAQGEAGNSLTDLTSVSAAERPHIDVRAGIEQSPEVAPRMAGKGVSEAWLYERLRRAYPYRTLEREEYTAVVRMLADGFTTRRGRRAAYLHRDAVNGRLRARKGARLTALTCGGAIPDTADYRVVLEPTGTPIGTLNEDFAIESMAGDIFQLGNASYRILKIEPGTVRVEDARGAPPTIPFWLGEAPARTDELSAAVSRLRAEIDARLGAHVAAESMRTAGAWLAGAYRLSASAAEQIVDYLAATKGVLSVVPTQRTVVLERFFDETGGMQLVIHAPFGNRINRAWGLALRKRFCRKFNFELQAAATEDAIVLSLGETHSFPLDDVARYLHSNSVREVLVQALLDAPLFTTRWRWTATIALALKRFRGGRRTPAPLQRMNAEDLVALVFPDQIACAENLAAEREIPDHPLVRQTIDDCLNEAMDVDGLVALLRALEQGAVRLLARDLPHPSPLAQEILNAKPYAFLDDAPLEERRTQAVMSRRWLAPLDAGELGRLDPEAIARVRGEAWPEIAQADELHDALMLLGFIEEREGRASRWTGYLDELIAARRATRLHAGDVVHWAATEQLPLLCAVYPDARIEPPVEIPAEFAAHAWTREAALIELVRGRLQGLGPVTADTLARSFGVPAADLQMALLALEAEGFVLRGNFTASPSFDAPDLGSPHPHSLSQGEREASREADNVHALPPLPHLFPPGRANIPRARSMARISTGDPRLPHLAPLEGGGRRAERAARDLDNTEWCERRLLARIHRYTVERLRAEIEPVTAADFTRFLFEWHGVTVEPRAEGPQALAAILEQLEGFEAAAMAWEADILPARTEAYDPDWLDGLCRSGRVVWTRLTPPKANGAGARAAGPVRNTPIALIARRNLRNWHSLALHEATESGRLGARAKAIADYLERHGASFFEELLSGTGLLRSEVEEGLRELVAFGKVQADSFGGLRALLLPADRRRVAARRRRGSSLSPILADTREEQNEAASPLPHYVPAQGAGKITRARSMARISTGDPRLPHLAPLKGGGRPHPDPSPASGRGDFRNIGADARFARIRSNIEDAGRWSVLRAREQGDRGNGSSSQSLLAQGEKAASRGANNARTEDNIERVARALLRRYGVVFRKVLAREPDWLPPWIELLRVYRRLEARGEIRGGRFVAGFSGEQYAAPEAVALLRATRKKPLDHRWVSISAADPLNLVGIVTPGARVAALAGNRVLYRDGIPVAVQIGGKTEFVLEIPANETWNAHNALIRGSAQASSTAN